MSFGKERIAAVLILLATNTACDNSSSAKANQQSCINTAKIEKPLTPRDRLDKPYVYKKDWSGGKSEVIFPYGIDYPQTATLNVKLDPMPQKIRLEGGGQLLHNLEHGCLKTQLLIDSKLPNSFKFQIQNGISTKEKGERSYMLSIILPNITEAHTMSFTWENWFFTEIYVDGNRMPLTEKEAEALNKEFKDFFFIK